MAKLKSWVFNKGVLAVLLSIAIVSLLIVLSPRPAEAVSVRLTATPTSVVQGGSITFTGIVSIHSQELIPIQSVELRIFLDAGCNTELTYVPFNSPRSMTLASVAPLGSPYYGYGYGYGYDEGTGYGHWFGYGYGYGPYGYGPYGYGYGYGYSASYSAVLTYTVTLSTSALWPAGTYYARMDVDCGTHTYSSSPVSFTVVVPAGFPPVLPPATVGVGEVDLTEYTSPTGELTQTVAVTSTDGIASATIPAGTRALDREGNPLSKITCQPPVTPPPVPPERHMLVVYDFGPDGATFDPPITITMKYDPAALPAGVAEEDLVLAYYDAATGTWVELTDIVVDTVNHTVSGKASHFTQFAVLARLDVTAPVLSAISVSDITTTEATITWTTDEPATSQVEYGQTTAYGLVTPLDEELVTTHTVTLTGLDPATTYHFRVKSKDAAGNLAVSDDYTFTTRARPFPIWWVIGPIIAVLVLGLLVYFVGIWLPKRRREQS